MPVESDKRISRGGRPRKDVIAIVIKLRRCRKCGRFVSWEGNHKCGSNRPALKQANDNQDKHYKQKQMNHGTAEGESGSCSPKDKNDDNKQ